MQKKGHIANLMTYVYKSLANNLKCSYIAQIVKLDKQKALATVQPLAMINNKKLPEVESVPFITIPYKYRYINAYGAKKTTVTRKLDYKKGDTVLVIVMDSDDMYFKNKGKFKVTSKRKHALDFSAIIGKIASKNDFKFPD